MRIMEYTNCSNANTSSSPTSMSPCPSQRQQQGQHQRLGQYENEIESSQQSFGLPHNTTANPRADNHTSRSSTTFDYPSRQHAHHQYPHQSHHKYHGNTPNTQHLHSAGSGDNIAFMDDYENMDMSDTMSSIFSFSNSTNVASHGHTSDISGGNVGLPTTGSAGRLYSSFSTAHTKNTTSHPNQRHFAIALDNSVSSIAALSFCFETLLRNHDTLTIITVLPGWKSNEEISADGLELSKSEYTVKRPASSIMVKCKDQNGMTPEKEFQSREVTHDIRSILSKIKRNFGLHLRVQTTIKILWGDCKKAICEEVKKKKYQLLILGSGGKTIMKSIMIGSVSQYILQHAETKVVVIRNFIGDDDEQEQNDHNESSNKSIGAIEERNSI